MELKLATEEQAEKIVLEAAEFVKFTKMYSSCFSTAKFAIAEYIAATRGLTLRKRLVGDTYAPKI